MRRLKHTLRRLRESFRSPAADRAFVLLKVCFVLSLFVYMAWQVHHQVFSRRVREVPLSLALSFLSVQVMLMTSELLLSCLIKQKDATRRGFSSRALPFIRKNLAEHIAGEDRHRPLLAMCLVHGSDVQRSLADFLGSVEGAARARLTALASSLGVDWVWEKVALYGTAEQRKDAAFHLGLLATSSSRDVLRRMLADASPHVRTAACRSLLRMGDLADVDQVFHSCLQSPLLVRALLMTDLQPHAPRLLDEIFPLLLAAGEASQVAAALELAAGWMSRLPYGMLASLLVHPRASVRAAAVPLLQFEGSPARVEAWIFAGLADPEAPVRLAAARLSGKLRIRSAIPALESSLGDPRGEVTRESLRALAAMGPEGWQILERSVLSPDPKLAARAAEALSAAHLSPFEAA
ncbi:MAG: HEAT repeat domain-containing protein [Bryobacterales bacterium]|nr:HEAT repeat domain-containing protein [Bryobacterales bacterium]